MATMLDYLDWYGDLDFSVIPFNEVDNLILSQLAYLDLTGAVPAPPTWDDVCDMSLDPHPSVTLQAAARSFFALHPADHPEDLGPLISPLTVDLLKRAAESGRRFANVRMSCYERVFDPDRHEQFAAFLAELPDGSSYVAYEGTDASLVGWLEDCEISYRVVPSQADALAFLELAAALTRGPLRVGGHSKGGNLAAFAAATCDDAVRGRICDIWCNDSPGFEDRVVPLDLFRPLAGRIHLYTPEYSVVGALFDHVVPAVVIKSAGAGVMEHSALDWQVMRGSFVRGCELPVGSKHVNQAFERLIDSHDLPERKKLLDNLYDGLRGEGVETIADLFAAGPQGIRRMLGSINTLDDDDRTAMNDFLAGIVRGTVSGAVIDTVTPVARSIGQTLGEAATEARANATKMLEDFRAQQQARAEAAREQREKRAANKAAGQEKLPEEQTPADNGATGASGNPENRRIDSAKTC
jgi:hypothetical protein